MDTLSDLFSKWSWVDFCGRTTFVTWNMQYRDLDICFQYLVFQIPILVILMTMSAYYNGALRLAVRRSQRDLHILSARWSITLLLTVVPALQLYLEEFLYPGHLHSVDYLLAVVQCFSWLIHFFYVMALRHWLAPSLRGPYPMGVVWTAHFILSCMILRSNALIAADPESVLYASHIPLVFSGIQVLLQIFYLITLIPSGSNAPPLRFFSLNSGEDSGERTPLLGRYTGLVETIDQSFLGQPMEGSGSLSQLFFSWVDPLMKKGAAGKLEDADDLFDLPVQLTSFYLNAKISSTVSPDVRRRRPSRRSLLRALHICYWRQFYGVGLLKLCSDLLGFTGPLLLNQLIKFLEDGTFPPTHGYTIVFGLFLTTLLGAFFNSHFNFWMAMVGFKIRGALVSLIYKKLVNLNKVSVSKLSTGEIVNFMSTDMDRITNSCPSFHSLWSIPFQIAFTLYLLYQQVGLSFLAGVAFSVILIPINKRIADQIGKLSTKMMAAKDRRIHVMSEILRGIKAVKLYVLEEFFIDRVTETRKEELKFLAGRKYLDAVCVYFWATTPVIITILTFVTYTWFLGHKLTASVVFTTIALLNMLIAPLNAFPWVLNGLTEAWVSLKRLEKLMELPNLDLSEYYEDAYREENDNDLQIIDGCFTWGENKFSLSSIDLSVKKGQLIGITGPVGSGKSSLLAAIMAEMYKTSGAVVSDFEQGYGYVSQTPWLQKCSIKDNILFGEPFVDRKYSCVVKACALERDLDDLPRRDSTMVGDSGGTLSGGQRARIALARAVYQDFPVYLLDDILSAVDPGVARHIYDVCICGILGNKTRLLVTHQSRYLVNADHVILMNEGRIVRQGPPAEVLLNYVDLIAEKELDKDVVETREPTESAKKRVSFIIEKHPPNCEEVKATGSLTVKVYARYFRAVGTLLCILIVASILLMQGSKNVVDLWLTYWITNENSSLVNASRSDTFYLEIYTGLAVLNTVFTLFRAFLFAYGGLSAAALIHKSLLTRIIRAKMLLFQSWPMGQILNRFSADVCTIDDSLPFILNILLALLFQVIGTLVMVVYGLPWMCVLLATLAPIYVSLQNHYSITSRDLKRISSITLSPLYSHFSETIQGLEIIKSYRATSRFQHNNAIWLEANQKAQFCSSAVAQWLGIRLQLIGVVTVTVVGLLAISFNRQNSETSGSLLGLAITYALSLTGSLGSLVNAFTETERELISVERVSQYLDDGCGPDSLTAPETDVTVANVSLPFGWPSQGVISFVNVYFKYGNHLPYSLVNVSFTTRPAERIGIVGRTGAGKSSLIAALFRLAEISRGAITVDFVNVSVVSLNTLRSRMGIIPQEPFIFDGTVRTNLDPKGSHADCELWRALKETHLIQTVENLGGLEAPLSESSGLSVGQKQLLCLARAILQNAKIICIDEATANVDEETDRLIQKTLRNSFRQRTVLTIAHRVQTIIDSDRILVMGNGRVLEFDTPSKLLENEQSVFYQMVNER